MYSLINLADIHIFRSFFIYFLFDEPGAAQFAPRFSKRAVNFLRPNQIEIANQFAGRGGIKGEARFAGAEWDVLESGASTLVGALASIDCEVEELIERHNHVIVVGRVLATRSTEHGRALLYWRGRYDPFEPADFSAIA